VAARTQVGGGTGRNDWEYLPRIGTPEAWKSAVRLGPTRRRADMKRKHLLALAAIPMAMAMSHAAGAATPRAGVRFDRATQMVHLTIPDSCKPHGKKVAGTCTWLLWGDEPDVSGHPSIGYVQGGSGVLSLAAPKFCGVVQYDALVSGSNNIWHYVVGHRYTIKTCTPPPPPPPRPRKHCGPGMHPKRRYAGLVRDHPHRWVVSLHGTRGKRSKPARP
jgi:hypothetical protein